jgi:hypothetical protein
MPWPHRRDRGHAWLPPEEQTPEGIAAHWDEITATEGERALQAGFEQSGKMITKAAEGPGHFPRLSAHRRPLPVSSARLSGAGRSNT